MASPAQIHANVANARFSTGPRTAEGKARSSRNNLRHGLTLGVLALTPEEQIAFCQFEANLREEVLPEGLLEEEAFRQLLDGAWRLRKIHALLDGLIERYGEDPFVHPDAEAELRQLNRFRAAAEMLLYRSVKTLRELQTNTLYRCFHLTGNEREILPPLVNPGPKMIVGGVLRNCADRTAFYKMYGENQFACRFPADFYQVEPNSPSGVSDSGGAHARSAGCQPGGVLA